MRKLILSLLIICMSTSGAFAFTVPHYGKSYDGIGELPDVTITAPIANDLLGYNGTLWVNTDDVIINTIQYGAMYWDDLRVALASAGLNPTTNPDFAAFIGNTNAQYFDDTNANERLEFEVQLPHGYCEGEDVPVHIHVNSAGNTNAGNVEAQVECTNFANPSGGVHTVTTIYNGVAALDGTAYKNYIFGLGTLSGTGITISATAICSVNRNTSVSGDVTGDVAFITVDFHVPMCFPGSRQQFVQ